MNKNELRFWAIVLVQISLPISSMIFGFHVLTSENMLLQEYLNVHRALFSWCLIMLPFMILVANVYYFGYVKFEILTAKVDIEDHISLSEYFLFLIGFRKRKIKRCSCGKMHEFIFSKIEERQGGKNKYCPCKTILWADYDADRLVCISQSQ